MKLTHYCLLFGILTPLLVAPVRARAFDDQEDDDLGRKLAEMQLIRTADMVADPLSLVPFPWGDDALGQGSIEVRARRLLAVHLHGVPPASTFSVQFCGAVNSPARCQELGQIQSDNDGNANDAIPFPPAGNPWTGFFTLMRDGKTPITRCENAAQFQTLEQIDQPTTKAIVNPGGTNERFARANLKQAQIEVFPDNVHIFDQILAGKADLMITDAEETLLQQKLRPGLCAVHPERPFTFAEKAFMLPRGDEAFKQYVDQWINLIKGDGTLSRVINKWLK